MKSAEYLSSDILEENYLRSFYPFYIVQKILGSSRVDARDRFVTAPTLLQKIYSAICILTCLGLYTNVMLYFYRKYLHYSNIKYIIITTICLHYILYTSSIVNARFFNNNENIKFCVQMQKLDRKLKIDKNKFINDLMFKINSVTIIVILLILSSLYLTAFLTESIIDIIGIAGFLFAQLTFSTEWLCCSNILIYFFIRIRYINAIIINHLKGIPDIKTNLKNKRHFPTVKTLRCVVSDTHDFISSDTDIYLKDLFEVFVQYQNLYRFQIFLFCFRFVSGILLTFEFGLLTLQRNMLQIMECASLLTTTAIDLSIIIFICIRYEVFSREINNTKYLCITVLSRYYDGPLRKKAIKMLKMIREKPPRISVYDMWYMDASTMINIINLVTTLMVTLLQFALL